LTTRANHLLWCWQRLGWPPPREGHLGFDC
jgi:hypothetical protein